MDHPVYIPCKRLPGEYIITLLTSKGRLSLLRRAPRRADYGQHVADCRPRDGHPETSRRGVQPGEVPQDIPLLQLQRRALQGHHAGRGQVGAEQCNGCS